MKKNSLPSPSLALEFQLSAHEGDQVPRDGEAQTRASVFPGGGGVGLGEFLEDGLLFLLRDPDAGVPHREPDPGIVIITPCQWPETRISPPRVNFTAFPTRFDSTCRKRVGSPRTPRGPPAGGPPSAHFPSPRQCGRRGPPPPESAH